MKKIFLVMICIFLCISIGIIASNAQGRQIPANERAKEVSSAPEHSPVIGPDWTLDIPVYLPSNMEQIAFIHYAKGGEKGKPKPPPEPPPDEPCWGDYGIRWANPDVSFIFEEYFCQDVDADGDVDIDDKNSALDAITDSFNTWDVESAGIAFSISSTLDLLPPAADGINVVCWRQIIGRAGKAIAITLITYDKKTAQLYDVDIVLNMKYPWLVNEGVGDPDIESGNPFYFDVQNICTHEAGHSLVLKDLYENKCWEVTMYGYSNLGELRKRSLEPEDITGIEFIYGL